MSTVTILTNDQYLSVGDTLAATSGSYQLTLNPEGALILSSGSASSPPLWQSPKDPNANGGSYFAIMQSDGNFCVYRGQPGRIEGGVWATMCTIPGGGRCFAVIDADGVFAVYRGTDQANIQGLLWSLDSAGANLIQKWAPMIHLHPADKSHPDSVENFLAVASLYNGDGSPPVTPATVASLNGRSSGSYLAYRDGIYPTAANYRETGASITDLGSGTGQCTAPVYAKSFVYPTYTDIKYCLFFPCQNFQTFRIGIGTITTKKRTFEWSRFGRHGGDWEHVTVRLDPSGNLLGIYCGQHGGTQWNPQGGFGLQDGTHPEVWSALNSHAVYVAPDTFTTGAVFGQFLAFMVTGPWDLAWAKAVDTTALDDGLVMYDPNFAKYQDVLWKPYTDPLNQLVILDRNPTATGWLDFSGTWGPPDLDNSQIDDAPSTLPEDYSTHLPEIAKGWIVHANIPDKYFNGDAPASPKQQGWWNTKEPFPAPT